MFLYFNFKQFLAEKQINIKPTKKKAKIYFLILSKELKNLD